MTGEVTGKEVPRLKVVRLERLNEDKALSKNSNTATSTSPQKAAEQAVNVTFSSNASARLAIEKVAQFAGSAVQREVSVAMEQAARNRKEDVDSLAKKLADDVRDDPDQAMAAVHGLTSGSVDVLKSTPRN